ncbi:MAG: guanine deaminase, partial [Polaromonas sp.]|nr:guanine deaminase [Polaromonas sp.]
MKAYRASLLYFSDLQGSAQAIFEQDGLLVTGPDKSGRQVVQAIGSYQGSYQNLASKYPDLAIAHMPGRIIAPGFVDMHIHYPQLDVIGSPAEGLLPWLENYTFPHEKRFSDPEYSAPAATFFVAELLRHGVTTALTFATSHPESVNALLAEAQKYSLRMIAGKVLMDQNSPDGVRDDTVQGLLDTEALINKWHGVDRLGYAITPRFVPSCSAAQLRGAGELAAKYPDVWIQSHVAENKDEIAWVRQLYPDARSYLSVYEQFGLLRPRAVYAHCIHIDDEDRALMRATGAAAAISPTSNLFLGSGFFDYVNADRVG